MVKPSGPVYDNVALLTIKTGSTFHTSTSANTTKIKQAVEKRRIIANVKLGLFRTEVVRILWRDSLQKIDIVAGVKLGHFQWRGWLGSLNYIVSTSSKIVPDQVWRLNSWIMSTAFSVYREGRYLVTGINKCTIFPLNVGDVEGELLN